jgi:hypothetical protein
VSVGRHLFVGGKVLYRKPELGQDIFHENAFSAALRKPSLAVVKAAAILVGYGFIVERSSGQSTRHAIDQHELQEANRDRNL